MGVDINLYLPTDVDPDDVSRVAAVLMGAKVRKESGYWDVEGRPRASGNKDIPQMANDFGHR